MDSPGYDPALKALQAAVCNLFSMFIESAEDFQGLLQTLNRRAMVSQRFGTVLSDLNRAADRFPGTYVEQFAQACGSEVLNEESCWLGTVTLLDTVRRLRGKCDVQALYEVSMEYHLQLSESECRDLLRLYQERQGLLG